jgi:solute carrier family 39 (zinc transporter), member 1/2/3
MNAAVPVSPAAVAPVNPINLATMATPTFNMATATSLAEVAGNEGGKPQCGGGIEQGEFDLPLHVAGLFLVLAASILGAGFPVVAKRVKWVKVPESIFFASKHFGTGVLVATAFVHLLPTAFFSLSDPCLPDLFVVDYPPMPGVIMMTAMFCLFVIEMYLNAKTGGHSHGGPTGFQSSPSAPRRPARPASFDSGDNIDFEKKMAKQMFEEKQRYMYQQDPHATGEEPPNMGDMPSWFIVFYEQYVRQRLEIVNMIKGQEKSGWIDEQPHSHNASSEQLYDHEGQMVDPAVYRKMSANITLLEGGILFHSIFVGMTVAITIDGFVVLLVAILFHQMFEGLGLGARIAEVPYPKGNIRPWVLVVAFGTTAPIGMAIGLATRGGYDPNSAFGLIIVGIFNAM